MSEFGTNDASHELIPLYMYALTLPTNKEKKRNFRTRRKGGRKDLEDKGRDNSQRTLEGDFRTLR